MSRASELLQQLRALGVQLTLEGETLRLNAPKGSLTPELQVELKAAKAEIIDLLRDMRANSVASTGPMARLERRDRMALSYSQQRLWFLHQMDPTNAAYMMLFLVHMKGEVQLDALEESLRRLVLRHESLRTVFLQEEGVPYAVVKDGSGWVLPRQAWTLMEGETLQETAARYGRAVLEDAFDLEQGPLFRARLLEIGEKEYILALVKHHVISDGWSTGIILRELLASYVALSSGKEAHEPPLALQYGDYAAWQRNWLEGGVLDRQMRYWRKQLDGASQVSLFPPDKRKVAGSVSQGRRLTRVLPSGFVREIEAFSKAHQVTPFMTFFSVYLLLLSRWTGQRDLVVGSPYANRNRTELSDIVGFFVNNLVLRVTLDEGMTFRDLLRPVRETTLGAFENPDVPFDLLVRELANDRDPEHAPIFQTMFTLQNFPLEEMRVPGMEVTPLAMEEIIARFDVSAEIWPYKGELQVYFDFNAAIYERETMDAIADGYVLALRAVIAEPERRLETVAIVSPERRAELLEFGNATELDVSGALLLPEALAKFAVDTPAKIAVSAGDEALSYAELQARVTDLAARLIELGVGQGTMVPVCLRRSVNLLVALLAVLNSGAGYVPLDPIYPPQRIAGILEDVAPGLLISETELLPLLGDYSARALLMDLPQPDGQAKGAAWPTVSANGLAYAIFTSGSTGKPKGVEISHGALANFLEAMRREPGFTSDDCVLAVTTVSFDIAGLELFLPIFTGGSVAIAQSPGDLPSLLHDLERYQPTMLQATPALWQMLVSSGWEGDAKLTMLCGGEALTAQLANELVPRGKALWNMYGPTETTIWSSALLVREAESANMPIGGPIANTTFYVLDALREPVPMGVAGELYIGGKGVARGYFKRPELTAERFVASPFRADERLYRTGDLVRQRRDGTLEFLGRSDFQVKLRGFRIELGEIEFAMRQQPEVMEAVVLLRDVQGQKELVAYLVLKPEKSLSYSELRARLRDRLPDYMVPAGAVMMEAFPRLPNGKLDRSKLPAPEIAEAEETAGSFEEPANETEAAIVRVFRELLKTDRVGVQQRFFDMGAHSLMLVKAHDVLRRSLDAELKLVSLFQYPSVAALAQHIDQRRERSAELAHAGNS